MCMTRSSKKSNLFRGHTRMLYKIMELTPRFYGLVFIVSLSFIVFFLSLPHFLLTLHIASRVESTPCSFQATLPVTDIIFIVSCQCLLRETKLYVHLHTKWQRIAKTIFRNITTAFYYFTLLLPRCLQTRDKIFYWLYLNKYMVVKRKKWHGQIHCKTRHIKDNRVFQSHSAVKRKSYNFKFMP